MVKNTLFQSNISDQSQSGLFKAVNLLLPFLLILICTAVFFDFYSKIMSLIGLNQFLTREDDKEAAVLLGKSFMSNLRLNFKKEVIQNTVEDANANSSELINQLVKGEDKMWASTPQGL